MQLKVGMASDLTGSEHDSLADTCIAALHVHSILKDGVPEQSTHSLVQSSTVVSIYMVTLNSASENFCSEYTASLFVHKRMLVLSLK